MGLLSLESTTYFWKRYFCVLYWKSLFSAIEILFQRYRLLIVKWTIIIHKQMKPITLRKR